MTREQALKEADTAVEMLLCSGDEELFEAAKGPDGRVDHWKLALACASARDKLADKIMRGEV